MRGEKDNINCSLNERKEQYHTAKSDITRMKRKNNIKTTILKMKGENDVALLFLE